MATTTPSSGVVGVCFKPKPPLQNPPSQPLSLPTKTFGLCLANCPKSLKLHLHLHLHSAAASSSSFFDFPLATKILIRNLSYTTSESALQKEFSAFGEIAEVNLVRDQATKKSKGYAFIQYTCQDDAMLALESMDQKYFDGRLIHLEVAKPRERDFGGYPKTCGPPAEQNSPKNDEAED